jgi:hypothetical protein
VASHRMRRRREPSTPRSLVGGIVALISLAACAHLTPAPVRETATPQAAVAPAPSSAATDRPAGAETSSTVGPAHLPAAKTQNNPDGRVTARKAAPSTPSTPSASPVSRASSTSSTSSTPTGPTHSTRSSGGGDAPPPLGLSQLEQRLRDTHAIGVFTKLSLKNKIDDLLDQFRAYHLGASGPSLAELRKRYDALLHQVIDLLQSDDASLAQAIWSSREAIWSILTDPAKVSQL